MVIWCAAGRTELVALDPVSETLADHNSYGFRWCRRCADAIGQCFVVPAKSRSPRWVLEADIKACFDEISHDWIIENVPMDKRVLEKWLKSGYMEDKRLFPSHKGTPQEGARTVLRGMGTDDGLRLPDWLYETNTTGQECLNSFLQKAH